MQQSRAKPNSRWASITIIVLTLLVYAAMAPIGYAALALVSILPYPSWKPRARLLQYIVRQAFSALHGYLRWIRFLDFQPRNVCPVGIGACVVVANHPTLTDALAMLASVPNACTAVRGDLYDQWWLKPLLAGAGHFSAGGANPLGGVGVLEGSIERLQQGFRVLLFPEGTRSPASGGLRRFGRTAFEAACRAEVPLVAVLIHEQPPWLAKGDRIATPKQVPSVKTIELLLVAHPADFLGDSRRLRDYVESSYRRALGLQAGEKPVQPDFPDPAALLLSQISANPASTESVRADSAPPPMARKAIGEYSE